MEKIRILGVCVGSISIIIKLLAIIFILVSLCSCSKEEYWTRNWQVPIDLNDPTGIAGGGSITWEIGIPDSILIKRIIENQNLTNEEAKYLSLTPYAYNGQGNTHELTNPDPRYMRFPQSIASTSNYWGWDHLYELCQSEEEEFCNKYFNGERTLGMTMGEWDCSYVESWY